MRVQTQDKGAYEIFGALRVYRYVQRQIRYDKDWKTLPIGKEFLESVFCNKRHSSKVLRPYTNRYKRGKYENIVNNVLLVKPHSYMYHKNRSKIIYY